MLNICFDLTAVDLAKPNLTETLAHEQLGSSDMIGRQCSVRRSLRHAHRIASQISDIATIPVTTANAANIPDVVAQKRDDEMQPIVCVTPPTLTCRPRRISCPTNVTIMV